MPPAIVPGRAGTDQKYMFTYLLTQVVQERSSRDHYRNLKKTIVAKLGRGGGNVVSDRASNRSGSTSEYICT